MTNKEKVAEHLDEMLKIDFELYEKVLDTPGFAFHFNEILKLAQSDNYKVSYENLKESFKISHDNARGWQKKSEKLIDDQFDRFGEGVNLIRKLDKDNIQLNDIINILNVASGYNLKENEL